MKNDTKLYPSATYRLQLHRDQDFAAATGLIPYLSRLGTTHFYSSPILRARKGSTHGYDVVDPLVINPDLGDESQFKNLIGTLRRYGLGFMLDIVPNHMAASSENPYWQNVLTYGLSSPYASWFDIDWRMPDPEMWGRVIAPVLDAPLKKMILQDQLHLEWQLGRFILKVNDQTWPIDPATVPRILRFGWPTLETLLNETSPIVAQLKYLSKQFSALPSVVRRVHSAERIDVDVAEKLLGTLAQTIESSTRVRQWAENTALEFGLGERGHRRMRKLVDAQPYRLVLWRKAARFMNYRRFFAINELISVRQENPRVFQATHESILRWVKEGLVDGLRIDHVDGLRDPLDYLNQLERAVGESRQSGVAPPLWVEKILGQDERLPDEWPVEGTTGYEFLNQVEAIFISPTGIAELDSWYREFQRRPGTFLQAVLAGKRRILKDDLSPHIGRLADMLLRIAAQLKKVEPVPVLVEAGASNSTTAEEMSNIISLELTKAMLVAAIVEVIVALPIYRSYVQNAASELSDHDRHYLELAISGARRAGVAEPAAIDFLEQILILNHRGDLPEDAVRAIATFMQKFQQFTGPAAAKGIEDTALYSYVPLVSLNEVGGQPDVPLENALAKLHEANAYRAKHLPHSMLCVTTHDTKRTADVRSRLDALSEIPAQWTDCVKRWLKANRAAHTMVNGIQVPDFGAEYLFYQTAVGIWPHDSQRTGENHSLSETDREKLRERLEQYMIKALREAKRHTNWTRPNEQYEAAIVTFIRHLLPTQPSRFEKELQALVEQIAYAGYWNALARTVIQFTAPGFPDIYQGDEIWNFALVDPDNRRPVDFARRNQLLNSLAEERESHAQDQNAFWQRMLEQPASGHIKLCLIQAILQARRQHESLFQCGNYMPLEVVGVMHQHVFAYYRSYEQQELIVVVPRLTLSLVQRPKDAPVGAKVWGDTSIILPENSKHPKWINGLTNSMASVAQSNESPMVTLPVGQLLEELPVGLYFSVSSDEVLDGYGN